MKNVLDNAFHVASGSSHLEGGIDDLRWGQIWLCKRKNGLIKSRLNTFEPRTLLRALVRRVIEEALVTGRLLPHQLLAETNKRVASHNETATRTLKFPNLKYVESVLAGFPPVDVIRARDGEEAAEKYIRLKNLRAKLLH